MLYNIENELRGRPMTYEETMFLLVGAYLVQEGKMTNEETEKFFEKSFEIVEKTLDKSNQM